MLLFVEKVLFLLRPTVLKESVELVGECFVNGDYLRAEQARGTSLKKPFSLAHVVKNISPAAEVAKKGASNPSLQELHQASSSTRHRNGHHQCLAYMSMKVVPGGKTGEKALVD